VLATRYGMAAVDSIVHERWGRMVSLSGTEITHVGFEEALGKLNTVPQSRYDEAAILFG
jgi:6-phosphofructokinase